MNKTYKKLLEKQQYEFTGSHTAIKICTWTKKSIRNEGTCYKQKFYGISSHRCVQMSPSINFCNMDCIYCWRSRFNEPFKTIDNPKEIIDKCIKAQIHQLIGFKGNDKADKKKLEEAFKPLHFAISLTGEPLSYPKISELIKELKKQNLTSFVVTNGMFPDILKNMEPPTQLYISIDSPNEELFKKITKPDQSNAWQTLKQSLKVMSELKNKTRTTLRLTLIKDINMLKPENYAKLISLANPDFIEVKAYMHVGASKERLDVKNMPYHKDVKEFAELLEKHTDYKIIDEQEASRVVLMMKKDREDRVMGFD